MSAWPERDEIETRQISEYAYQLWEKDGRPDGRALKYWLTAEAVLATQKKISERPVSVPFLVSFTVTGLPASLPKLQWAICPDPPSYQQQCLALESFPLSSSPQALAVLPNQLPHDARLLSLQVASAVAALDRIARLLDYCIDLDSIPQGNFFEPLDTGPDWRLKKEYVKALLEPNEYPKQIGEIDLYLDNTAFSQVVAFNVLSVSTGSLIKVAAQLSAMGWRRAIGAIAIVLGLSFAQGYGHRAGEIFAEHHTPSEVVHEIIGRFEPMSAQPTVDFNDFWERAQAVQGVDPGAFNQAVA